ncbi:MAG: sulfur carrier protein ThiS [Alphaproteobacteria bacterium]|nr:sulfur carrier protein ThiS [Alphaproteobacteria bacterium]
MRISVTVNGTKREFEAPVNIGGALKVEGYEGMLVAVAVNGHFVPKAQHGVSRLKDGDEVEIVSPMQGG